MAPLYTSHYVTHPTRGATTPEMKAEALKAIDRDGVVHGSEFSITDVPYICYTSRVDTKIDLHEFAGRIRFGNHNNLNSGLYYPFQTALVRLTVVKTAPGKVGQIVVGDDTFLCSTTIVAYDSVTIGRNVTFGPLVTIMDCDGHHIDRRIPDDNIAALVMRPISIGENCWIGSGAVILKGVTIGRNSVVAINSVVTKSVPENCVVAGNPAKVVKTIT